MLEQPIQNSAANGRATGAKPWTKPELRKLEAGAAETAGAVRDDGVIGNS